MCVSHAAATCAQEQPNPLSVRGGVYRRPPGFQVDLVCLSSWMDGEAPGSITALSVNSAYGLYIIHYYLFISFFIFMFFSFLIPSLIFIIMLSYIYSTCLYEN
jgi:hypothetical protein